MLDGVFQRATTSVSLGAARDVVEIQLAIYILASWSHHLARGKPTNRQNNLARQQWPP